MVLTYLDQKEIKTRNKLFLLILIVCCSQFANCQSPQTGTLAPNQRSDYKTFVLTGYNTNDVIGVELEIISGHPLTSTSMAANLNNQIPFAQIFLEQFYGQDPRDQQHFDLDAMWNAKKPQYINFRYNGQPNLYVTVFNFDLTYRQSQVDYRLTIEPAGRTTFWCASCENGTPSSNCFCNNCPFQVTGKTCNRMNIQLQKNISMSLTPNNYQYFSITGTDKVIVQILIQGGTAQAYFQFQSFPGQVANFYNVAKGSSDARYVITNNGLKLGADTQQRKFLITLVSAQTYPINASISYSVENSVSVLVIVMSVLGGILLVALIVAVVCIIKKRNAGNRINSQLNIPSQTNKLSAEQIQRYFPCCNFSDLAGMSQSSLNPINTQQVGKEGGTAEQDCVICLEQISQSDQVRIGYCKHIFHGQCLVSWFKKQRNCPYCRKQFSRQDTVNEYNKIVVQNGNRVLKNTQLAKAIYQSKHHSKAVIQNIQ